MRELKTRDKTSDSESAWAKAQLQSGLMQMVGEDTTPFKLDAVTITKSITGQRQYAANILSGNDLTGWVQTGLTLNFTAEYKLTGRKAEADFWYTRNRKWPIMRLPLRTEQVVKTLSPFMK